MEKAQPMAIVMAVGGDAKSAARRQAESDPRCSVAALLDLAEIMIQELWSICDARALSCGRACPYSGQARRRAHAGQWARGHRAEGTARGSSRRAQPRGSGGVSATLPPTWTRITAAEADLSRGLGGWVSLERLARGVPGHGLEYPISPCDFVQSNAFAARRP
jgi:hypothetical protein